jgi:hypothetical protein
MDVILRGVERDTSENGDGLNLRKLSAKDASVGGEDQIPSGWRRPFLIDKECRWRAFLKMKGYG